MTETPDDTWPPDFEYEEDPTGLSGAVVPAEDLFPAVREQTAIDVPPGPDGDAIRKRMALERWWADAFREAKLTPADLHPFRLRVAWRVSREIARMKTIVALDETLERATAERPDGKDPWLEHCGLRYTDGDAKKSSAAWRVLRLHSPGTKAAPHGRGLGLLPPPVPEEFVEDGKVVESYDPRSKADDEALHRWLEALDIVVRLLGIERGSTENPQQGFLGLRYVLDPETVRASWPTRWEVMAFEFHLIEEVLEELTAHGVQAARRKLRDKYWLVDREVSGLVALARSAAAGRVQADLEELRALMVLRLEDLAERARDSLDTRVELNALKQLAIVQGLSKTEPEDAVRDFVDVVAKVSRADKRAVSAPPIDVSSSAKALPS
ncbi:MAG: hypothetical protein ACF8XB_10750 [Planctomycetota bacterium JB042]